MRGAHARTPRHPEDSWFKFLISRHFHQPPYHLFSTVIIIPPLRPNLAIYACLDLHPPEWRGICPNVLCARSSDQGDVNAKRFNEQNTHTYIQCR